MIIGSGQMMVRYIERTIGDRILADTEFQSRYGSIKRLIGDEGIQFVVTFQFQHGSIKRIYFQTT